MNKVFQVIAAAVVSVAFIGTSASAQQISACSGNITITNTGSGSNNTVDCNTITNVVINCVNNVDIATINFQNGTTGTAVVSGNTTGGGATTGAAINTNASNVNANASCGATTVASPTPTPSTTPTPGKGSITPTTPKALPNTASNSTASIVAASLAAAAAVVVASRLAVAAYRRIGTK